ncbi:MAG: translation initiation factor IF-2 [Phycisphaeraceae bacterium]|nr:translation initiation factor IF-2 [Phycisphaeraceae bacterium]MBX3366309.1 translation initiation factor IF-2 [Phycisphaeraceae bacterium]
MAKRVFEIAKELGIDSKAVVKKCQAEGIPESVIKNHMSTVSVGLEQTIREWFTEGANATAIETAAPVALEAVRTKPKARARVRATAASTDGSAEDSSASSTLTVEATSTQLETQEQTHHETEPPEHSHAEEPRVQETPAPVVADVPATIPTTSHRGSVTSEPIQSESAPSQPSTVSDAPARAAASDRDHGTHAPAAPHSHPTKPHHPPRPPATRVQPAPMNVPNRPTVVSPAGQRLEAKAPVKLSGPKVVRVEAPEFVEAPRARGPRPGGGYAGSGGPGGGPGTGAPRQSRGPGRPDAGGPVGGGEDDRGRAPKRGGPPSAAKGRSAAGVPSRRRATAGEEWTANPDAWTEQDLAEREARLARAAGFMKQRRQQLKKQGVGDRASSAAETGGTVKIAAPFTIKDLSAATGVKAADIVKRLFLQGVMATINSGIDVAKAQEIMMDFDIELEVTEAKTGEEAISAEFEKRTVVDQRVRGPVVTILGHVDHGKTSLLDKIRNANVAAGEAGGITQRTSAFRVPISVGSDKKEIVFFDTPGHQAFTEMRARGANVTDIVVLVCSPADGGVMPQTIESINHAKAAKVPIVVALNKIDRPEATDSAIQKTLGQLAEHGLNPIEWGGETEVVRTSAVTGQGIEQLLEILDLQSQLLELQADFDGSASGNVIEARMEEGRGPVANILVRDGKLKVGDFIVAGRGYGRVRDITDDRGNKLREALPPTPVQISGLDEVPDAGDRFFVVDSLRKAQEAAEQRRHAEREAQLAQPKVTLDSLFTQMSDKDIKEILVVVKAAEQGTLDVLKNEIEKISHAEVKTRVLHAAIGGITESDVILAEASKAIVIGFNVIASGKARSVAESKGVEIRNYQVIYHITDDLKKAAEGLLTPELRQEVLGHAEVRQVFKITKVGSVAGCYVTDGVVQRDALIRVTRNGVVVENDRRLSQLKRVKDDAKEVRAGMECGMKIDGYDDIKEGDVLECYKNVEVKRTL